MDFARHSILSSTNDGEVGGIPWKFFVYLSTVDFFFPFFHSFASLLSCVFILSCYCCRSVLRNDVFVSRGEQIVHYVATIVEQRTLKTGKNVERTKGIESIKIVCFVVWLLWVQTFRGLTFFSVDNVRRSHALTSDVPLSDFNVIIYVNIGRLIHFYCLRPQHNTLHLARCDFFDKFFLSLILLLFS